jgi:hemerythrin-like domain-containing protein
MDPIDVLRREHATVKLVLKAASLDLDRVEATNEADLAELDRLIEFFRYFNDACHDPKEEDLLFCMMHRRGMSWDEYPLSDVVREHEEMRVVLSSAADWLPLLRDGSESAVEPLVHNLRAYVDLVTDHFAKEEETVFPLALRTLSADDFDELTRAFDTVECEEDLEGVRDYYRQLARELSSSALA